MKNIRLWFTLPEMARSKDARSFDLATLNLIARRITKIGGL
jgi:hypothetical protein